MTPARRRAVEEVCLRRPSAPLEAGKHMVLSHALRCTCPKCERIINWDDADGQGIITGACCQLVFRLFPFTVKVKIESTRPEILLPPHRQRLFPLDGTLLDYGGVEVIPQPKPPDGET